MMSKHILYLNLNLPPVLFGHTLFAVKKPLLAFTLGLCLATLPAFGQLALSDVQTIIDQAVTRAAQVSPSSMIAVVDREGFVLGVWMTTTNDPLPGTAAFTNILADAIAKGGTASYLSSDQHAFTSRTAGFIVQQNFPPNVKNSGPGPLVGVNFSNLQFSDINKIKNYASPIVFSNSPGNVLIPVPQPVTGGLAGTPGGIPLFKDGHLVGGIGVAHDGDNPTAVQIDHQFATVDEDVALAGQTGYAPDPIYNGDNVTINGFRLAYINSATSLGPLLTSLPGTNVPGYPLMPAKPAFPYPTIFLGGQTNTIRQPIVADTFANPLGAARLSYADVTNILGRAANRARSTRAGIRLPRGQVAQVFITVVNNPGINGVTPQVLGTISTPGATIFSWDVAVQKARTAVFFSSTNYAFSVRAVGFLAQEFYPPGINSTAPGLFWGLQERYSMFPQNVINPLDGVIVTNVPAIDPNLTNGITIFPGGFPLYRNGVVIGAIGVSGDGVDQDDIIAASGTQDFLAPVAIRTDQFFYSNARLPYAKFP
ncbi:MAG: hypothetical protein JWQ04_1992, partial [Pedosphaera sp.]|nr:hypothetical protein [Pedosphaera sp.]